MEEKKKKKEKQGYPKKVSFYIENLDLAENDIKSQSIGLLDFFFFNFFYQKKNLSEK